MRRLRVLAVLLALPLMTAACIGAAPLPQISSTGGTPSQASASQSGDGGGGGGDGANGSITYRISGDYTKSGELPFVPLSLSLFADGGWVAWFAEGSGGSPS
ncbi:MAG: hypothetical protein E6J47_07540 [Chloroflexi bacterium]|nr:MAG: hypothetical protein E6J47_07540 [Chloroflexota bacterium]